MLKYLPHCFRKRVVCRRYQYQISDIASLYSCAQAAADMMMSENASLQASNDLLTSRVAELLQTGARLRGTINTLTEDLNQTRATAVRERAQLSTTVDKLERKLRCTHAHSTHFVTRLATHLLRCSSHRTFSYSVRACAPRPRSCLFFRIYTSVLSMVHRHSPILVVFQG